MKQTKHKVFNLIILDESGSMNSIKNMIISGFNEVVQTVKGVAAQFPEQEHLISFVTFNGLGTNTHLDRQPVGKLDEIDGKKYLPAANTPLFDAMGDSIAHLRAFTDGEKACNVLVTILTDGQENASREYNRDAIKKLIDELENKNWTFTYIGADHPVEKFAASISIKNVMRFEKNQSSMRAMFARERQARGGYSRKIRRGEDVRGSYYSDDKKGKPS